MSSEKEAKLKALKLTLDKLDKTYGKGAVMKMGDDVVQDVEVIPSGSLGLDLALDGLSLPLVVLTALLTTLYGVIFANLIYLPVGAKLERLHNAEMETRELVIEGVLPFVSPPSLRRMLETVSQLDDRSLRITGLVSMILGVFMLYLVR